MWSLLSLATLSFLIYDGAALSAQPQCEDFSADAQEDDMVGDVAAVSMLQMGLDRGKGPGTADSQHDTVAGKSVIEEAAEVSRSHTSDCSTQDTSEWIEMAQIQASAYFSSDVPGWTKLARMEVTPIRSPDHLLVYAKDGICALTFHGANDAVDTMESNNFSFVDRCGGGVHGGWWPELMNFLQDPRWESEIVPILTGPQCSHVYTVGHSMGGFLSGLFAACANMNDLLEVSPGMQAITVEKVYSFGAPSIAMNPPRNALSASGCFEGARFFINDAFEYDFAPALWTHLGFKHPYLLPINLELDSKQELVCSSPGVCTSVAATDMPSLLDLQYEYEVLDGSTSMVQRRPKFSSHTLHDPLLYVTRMASALNVTL